MALEHRLEAKMMQKLVLTPQLQQAIKLLQMPQLELSMTLNNEMTENPFLEETVELVEQEEVSAASESETMPAPSEDAEIPLEKLLGFSVDGYFDSRSMDGRDLGYFSPDTGPEQTFEQFVSNGADLYDHLNWQLRLSSVSEDVRKAAEAVIGNINEKGYLKATAEEIAAYDNVPQSVAEEAVAFVQTLDPPGVGARDLRECLLLQLGELDLRGSLVEKIISHNLGDVEKRRYKQIALQHEVAMEEVMQALKVIEGMDPRPGSAFSDAETVYIKPDVYVARDAEGFRVVLNDENVPNLRINNYYRKILSQKNLLDKNEKEYLTERLRSAVWLLKSLDHRNKTIYRVTESLTRFQYDFFDKNVSHLRPLNLKDVAQDLGLHESTISRATSNKYLSCSHGLFSFRFFFSSGLSSGDGAVSSNYFRDLIRKIIEEEDSQKPLSDQKIADILKGSGISIKVARRTVAKYRDEMNIAPQSQRRSLD
jgi:RNA polymerase sigma-54 factor